MTVYCQSGLDSDFLSTLIFVGGTEKIKDYIKDNDIQVLAIDKDKKIYKSEGLGFELTDESYSYADN